MTEKYTPAKGDYIKVQGNKQYLPVPARVQWFRGEHPDWTIHTSVVELAWDAGYAVMRAEVLDDTGRLIASGMKTETRKGFGDFVEKAETGAVGRALARAGYGTEDALDLEGNRYADAPIEQPEQRGGSPLPSSPRAAPAQRTAEEQVLLDMLLAHNLDHEAQRRLADKVGVPIGQRASAAQLRAMLDLIESPSSEPAPVDGTAEVARASVVSTTPEQDGVSPATPAPAAPTDAEILAAAGPGAEIVEPKKRAGRTVDEAIADAKARAEKAGEPEQLEVSA